MQAQANVRDDGAAPAPFLIDLRRGAHVADSVVREILSENDDERGAVSPLSEGEDLIGEDNTICDVRLLLVRVFSVEFLEFKSMTEARDLATRAMLYSYALAHNEGFFGGRLDRIVALDEGRCAEILLEIAGRCYPGDDFGRDEWAHACVLQILQTAREHLALARQETR